MKVWDVRQAEDPVALMQPNDNESRRDCWAVAFGNTYTESERIIAAGYDNGDIKLFDLRTMSVRWETNIKNGVCCRSSYSARLLRDGNVCEYTNIYEGDGAIELQYLFIYCSAVDI